MKKRLLLSVCLIFTCSLSACINTVSDTTQTELYINDEDLQMANTLNCDSNDANCNKAPLVNYTKTEADFKQYGERTKESHLYTQAAVGNNLSSAVAPSIESDVVKEVQTANEPEFSYGEVIITDNIRAKEKKQRKYVVDDGVFSKTATLDLEERKIPTKPKKVEKIEKVETIETKVEDIITAPVQEPLIETVEVKNEVGIAKKIEITKTVEAKEPTVIKKEIECVENCDVIYNKEAITDTINDVEDEIITSEYTEESFNIADYADEEQIEFKEVGSIQENTDIDIKDVIISDSVTLTWEANEGDNLKDLLTKWSEISGWKLLWKTNRNYTLTAGVMFKGKFADVSSALIRAFARARPAPIATYYKGNRVIVVETMENENAY